MMQGGNRQFRNNHFVTPGTRCSICSRPVPSWSIAGASAPGICHGCGKTFCKSCGVPFLCRICLDRLPNGKKRVLLEQHHKYKAILGGSIAMRIVGGMMAYYSSTYLQSSITSIRYSSPTVYYSCINPLCVILPSIFLAIGAVLFFSGLILRIFAKFPMQVAVSASFEARPGTSNPMAPIQDRIEPITGALVYRPRNNGQGLGAASSCMNCRTSLPPVENLRFCPRCGKKVEGKRFCMYCGNSLPRINGLVFCPDCGKRIALQF
ncbi:MAG TPA: zinc ribbon domain-containing protein [Candidatus Lokiarchaeia archaeon]|nr:zinc ribbon domain-containing protein [Candidatus Lokiarchaeia archaeon]